jgi:hypothetical protein
MASDSVPPSVKVHNKWARLSATKKKHTGKSGSDKDRREPAEPVDKRSVSDVPIPAPNITIARVATDIYHDSQNNKYDDCYNLCEHPNMVVRINVIFQANWKPIVLTFNRASQYSVAVAFSL